MSGSEVKDDGEAIAHDRNHYLVSPIAEAWPVGHIFFENYFESYVNDNSECYGRMISDTFSLQWTIVNGIIWGFNKAVS